MTERDFQISLERQLSNVMQGYNDTTKFTSDFLFYYINKAKDAYVSLLCRQFQLNQELSDKLRTLVQTKTYEEADFVHAGSKWETNYPDDYLRALGEETYISIRDNRCPNLVVKSSDVIEATIETVNRKLENSLSEHILRYNNAKPIRVYSDNKIHLYTDGKYDISSYSLTYLRKAKDLGKYDDLTKEYTDLPEETHQEIVDGAFQLIIDKMTPRNSQEQEEQ